MEELIFELKDTRFSYLAKFPALCGVDMRINRAEKIALIGANGCGKSTLLHLLDALLFPNEGSIYFMGKRLNEKEFRDAEFSRYFRKTVGLVFQNPDVQLFCPTVKEDIMFGPLQLGVEKAEIKKRFEKLVETFSIKELLERSPHQLSIGEKRKVAIASTLAIEPDILLLDEPTAGLDPQTTRHIIDIVVRAHEEGKTVVTSTHDLHIVEEMADTVYVFSRHKNIARKGPAAEVLADKDFLNAHNLLHIHSHRHKDHVHIHPHEHIDHHHTHEEGAAP